VRRTSRTHARTRIARSRNSRPSKLLEKRKPNQGEGGSKKGFREAERSVALTSLRFSMDDPSGLSFVFLSGWVRACRTKLWSKFSSHAATVLDLSSSRDTGRAAAIARCGDESREEAEDDLHTSI
jgi:hypothetical protein